MSAKELKLHQIAELTHAKIVGNPDHIISGVDDLASAGHQDISFLAHPRYLQAMQRSHAGAIFVAPSLELPKERNFLIVENPSSAFQILLNHFYDKDQSATGFNGIHETAVIHPTAELGTNVSIGPYVVIDRNVKIGNGTILFSHVTIGPSTFIGSDCLIYSQVTIRERCQIGNRVILQSGCVIGSCGFGYNTTKEGKHIKLEQTGIVILEDDVEIGANSTIDRARFKSTHIGRGTKIDNQVQIGHGAQIGPNNLFIAQVGVAGSTQTGSNVVLGGKVGILGHIKIAKNVRVAAYSGVSKSLDTGDYSGIPAAPITEYNRNAVYVRNLERHIKKIEDRIKKLESKLPDANN